MACEACSVKFTLFKRKKQCTSCMRNFCSECVIKLVDKIITCDTCSLLSMRPLRKSLIVQMRPRDMRHYLLGKKVSVKGCVEKEDLINLLMLISDGIDDCPNTGFNANTSYGSPSSRTDSRKESRTESCPVEQQEPVEQPRVNEDTARVSRVEIEEIEATAGTDSSPSEGPQPLISEQDDASPASEVPPSGEPRPETLTEVPTGPELVRLSDINESADLENLSVKQLKILLSTNRVNYKGCVERSELLDRATRLWEEYRQSRLDVKNLDEEDLCKICWDEPIECVILECGHMACCINCGKQMSECPICKQYVVRVVRFFKA